MTDKVRIDQLLVELGFFESRAAARASIESGGVTVDGAPIGKPSVKVSVTAEIEAVPAHPYVSRGGLKLAHALDFFAVDPQGWRCVDLGASTGGFTDVLLKRGAAHVLSVDVGRGQLHQSLHRLENVTVREQTDIRDLTAEDVGADVKLFVGDLSFISLSKALPAVVTLADDQSHLVVLFKPQFEVGRDHVGKGGIVSDQSAVTVAKSKFETWLEDCGWHVISWTDSPITGGDGNREYLLHAQKGGGP